MQTAGSSFDVVKTLNSKIMKTLKCSAILILIALISYQSVHGQEEAINVKMAGDQLEKKDPMKTYLIEREIPQAGELSGEQLKAISQQSCSVLKEMGPEIQWLHSYVTDDKVYCLYKATDEDLIRKHAEAGGFPVNYITELATRIDPGTAN